MDPALSSGSEVLESLELASAAVYPSMTEESSVELSRLSSRAYPMEVSTPAKEVIVWSNIRSIRQRLTLASTYHVVDQRRMLATT